MAQVDEDIAGQVMCACGCGEPAPIAKITSRAKGWVKGEPKRFVHGHNYRGVLRKPNQWREEDRGYETPCWVWQLSTRRDGYGQVTRYGRNLTAHVAEWERANGPVPEGLELDHLCRVRACCNPDHLEPVTRSENIRRGARAKLTPQQVRTIRGLLAEGWTCREAGERFGVAKQTVESIKARRIWADVA